MGLFGIFSRKKEIKSEPTPPRINQEELKNNKKIRRINSRLQKKIF